MGASSYEKPRFFVGLLLSLAAHPVLMKDQTTHVRVRQSALQQLRKAIVERGGVFHGRLTQEASIALEERAAALAERDEEEGSDRSDRASQT